MKIWAHTLVKNEERYIWYAVMSVIDYVDRILIWDTGSTDKTFEIVEEIKKLYPDKVDFREVGNVDINQFTTIRNKMLDRTNSDWFMILDGDEVWWKGSISEIVKVIASQGNNLDSILTKNYNVVGDIFHYQKESVGKYEIDGIKGHINIRFINRRIPGLSFNKPHGQQGIFDDKGVLIQKRDKRKRLFLKNPAYLHFTNMIRSSEITSDRQVPKRKSKYKYDLGRSFPLDFYYPEIFFKPKPSIITDPWNKVSKEFIYRSWSVKPLRYFKGLFPNKSGY